MTQYNQRKRMEFEDNTRTYLKEIGSKLDIVFQICHQVITTTIDREIQKQLDVKLTELKGYFNIPKEPEKEKSQQKGEHSNASRGAAKTEDKKIGNSKSKKKKKK